jgi:hypothetical protein
MDSTKKKGRNLLDMLLLAIQNLKPKNLLKRGKNKTTKPDIYAMPIDLV